MNAHEVMVALKDKYGGAEWAFLPQVRSATGSACVRTADGLAMNLWPSRGLALHGFEIKVERGDWLRELRDPSKAEEICQFCEHWWVVAGDKDIVRDGELPPTWGLLVPRGRQLVVKVAAPKKEASPIDKSFLAAILRRAQECSVPKAEIQAELDAAVDAGQRSGRHEYKYKVERAENRRAALEKAIELFEQRSGLRITEWNAGDVGKAVKALLAVNQSNRLLQEAEGMRDKLRERADQMDNVIEVLEKRSWQPA